MQIPFGRDQSTESLGPIRKLPVDRNAINPVYVAWSAGGQQRFSHGERIAGGKRAPTNN